MPFRIGDLKQLQSAKRKIFAHYFTPFPLSIDNLPSAADYYAQQFLKRTGENSKYYNDGGYLRERPLPVGPWQSQRWQEINLAIEMLRARRIGIDGFGVDLLTLSGLRWKQTLQLVEVAAAVTRDFFIVPEPDMAALDGVSEDDLIKGLTTLLASPAIYHLPDGRALIIPFKAEAKPPAFWQAISEKLAKQGHPIALILDFIDPSNRTAYEGVSLGYTTWGLRDPVAIQFSDTKDSLRSWISWSSNSRPIMMPVAPQDARPKEAVFWEAQNTSAFRALWAKAIDSEAQFAHLITWNDYSEATEVSPSSATQYVFYDLAAYYASWFKLGAAPPVEKDAIFYTHRRQVLNPDTRFEPGDRPLALHGRTGLTNNIEMLAFLTEAASMEIEVNGEITKKAGKPGLNILTAPARAGRPVFRIKRPGGPAVELTSRWDITDRPDLLDAIYAGGSSTRDEHPKPTR